MVKMMRFDWKRFGSVRDAITTVVGDHYGLYGTALPLSTDLREELGGDPLDLFEVFIIIEELFQIRLDDAARGEVTTLGDLVKVVQARLGKP